MDKKYGADNKNAGREIPANKTQVDKDARNAGGKEHGATVDPAIKVPTPADK